jgi:hypothetical protein
MVEGEQLLKALLAGVGRVRIERTALRTGERRAPERGRTFPDWCRGRRIPLRLDDGRLELQQHREPKNPLGIVQQLRCAGDLEARHQQRQRSQQLEHRVLDVHPGCRQVGRAGTEQHPPHHPGDLLDPAQYHIALGQPLCSTT